MKKKTKSRKRHSFRIIYVFLLLIIVIIGGVIYFFWGKNPFKSKWDYNGRFTVIDINTYTIVSYPSDESRIITISLSPDMYIEVPGGYGYYAIKDIPALGKSEKKGDDFIISAFSSTFGIPIEGMYNNLSFLDRIKIQRVKKNTQVLEKNIDLSNIPVVSEQKRSDGSSFTYYDKEKISFYLGELFWEVPIKKEGYTIGIYNASGVPGIAMEASRILESIGYHVVAIGNWEETIGNQCQIALRPNDPAYRSYSVVRLQKITHCNIVFRGSIPERFTIQLILTHSIL